MSDTTTPETMTYTPADIAALCNTTPKILRRWLRAHKAELTLDDHAHGDLYVFDEAMATVIMAAFAQRAVRTTAHSDDSPKPRKRSAGTMRPKPTRVDHADPTADAATPRIILPSDLLTARPARLIVAAR